MTHEHKKSDTQQEGNEAEDFLVNVIIKIVATTAIMATFTIAAVYYVTP